MSPRLAFALELAYDAGRSTLSRFDVSLKPEYKADGTPVTEADRAAEALIRARIAERYPQDGILGEEEGEAGTKDSRWVVDPIDGTKSFICGVPLYATLLSFEEKGEPRLGVCYFPALEKMVYAEAGAGAYCNGRPCKVSSRRGISGSVLCCGSHASMHRHGRADGFLSLALQALATRTWGDAFGHALVALGQVDAMFDPVVNRWDISAMQLIVEEAGGQFTGFDGTKNPQTEAVSSNGLLHAQLLAPFSR